MALPLLILLRCAAAIAASHRLLLIADYAISRFFHAITLRLLRYFDDSRGHYAAISRQPHCFHAADVTIFRFELMSQPHTRCFRPADCIFISRQMAASRLLITACAPAADASRQLDIIAAAIAIWLPPLRQAAIE